MWARRSRILLLPRPRRWWRTVFYSPALLNHCIRSYLWGMMYGAAHAIAFDDELYYVSAILHDIGLTDVFDSHTVAFEKSGTSEE